MGDDYISVTVQLFSDPLVTAFLLFLVAVTLFKVISYLWRLLPFI